jgi:hypothetical protein
MRFELQMGDAVTAAYADHANEQVVFTATAWNNDGFLRQLGLSPEEFTGEDGKIARLMQAILHESIGREEEGRSHEENVAVHRTLFNSIRKQVGTRSIINKDGKKETVPIYKVNINGKDYSYNPTYFESEDFRKALEGTRGQDDNNLIVNGFRINREDNPDLFKQFSSKASLNSSKVFPKDQKIGDFEVRKGDEYKDKGQYGVIYRGKEPVALYFGEKRIVAPVEGRFTEEIPQFLQGKNEDGETYYIPATRVYKIDPSSGDM